MTGSMSPDGARVAHPRVSADADEPSALRALVVSLHDVSPRTHADCAHILDELRELGVKRCSLLVIPNHHRRGHFLDDAGFCRWLRELAGKGNEIVAHGYYHQRARRSGETLGERIATRIYTADEGEFYDIDRESAAQLLAKSRADFARIDLAPVGFIAPAWLLSNQGEAAARELGFEYTTRLGSVVDLRTGGTHRSQSLVWSVRSAWRRVTSLAWNALLFRALADNPLMRISVHPVDIHHPPIRRQIRRLMAQALEQREPLTYQRWIARNRSETQSEPEVRSHHA